MRIQTDKLNDTNNTLGRAYGNRGARVEVASLWATICTLAMVAGMLWLAQWVPANSSVSNAELDAAVKATLEAVLTNAACPQDPEALQEFVAGSFVLLRPDLVQRELENDPAFVANRAAAQWTILHPDATFAALMADPEQRKAYRQALEAIMVSPPPEAFQP